jgi:hypothetical protein
MDTGPSFGWLVFARAFTNTRRFFWRFAVDAPVTALSLAVGSALFGRYIGWEVVRQEWLIFVAFVLAPGGLFVVLTFLWNLWLAPSALAYEAHRSDLERWNVSGLPPKTTLADARSKALAGTLRRMGESAGRSHFKGLDLDSTPFFDFTEIMQSAHPIWTRQDAAQLRRDFENQVGRLAEANKEFDQKARMEVKGELELTISNLSNILLGNA